MKFLISFIFYIKQLSLRRFEYEESGLLYNKSKRRILILSRLVLRRIYRWWFWEKTAVPQSRRRFQEYPPQPKGALRILGERAMKEVKDTFKRKRLRVKRGATPAPPCTARPQRGRQRRTAGAAARRVLCNQSCFGASESTAPAFDRRDIACSVPSVLSVVVRRPSLSLIVRTYDW